ncbi:FkbM family methyltransferase [Accumulibacter sp.]|uniref:FkbM family methyltransferase n=1 Tax=Accumulibacter sp. TaxID=2053492 RepID=UPI0028C4CEA5|nr:FkbM family methyltransferase [Accumulibacter sp.]
MKVDLFNPGRLLDLVRGFTFNPEDLVPEGLRNQFRVDVRWNDISVVRLEDDAEIRLGRVNGVYVQDMVAFFDYYFSSVSPTKVGHGNADRQVVDFSRPHDQNIVGFGDFPIHCPSLAEPYMTCQQYLDFAQLRPGSIVLDLGAYSCLTSIAFSKAAGTTGKVLAIEPDPTNLLSCAINIQRHDEINKLANIQLFPIAVAGHSGKIAFSNEGSMGSAQSSVVGTHRGTVVSVDCRTLGQLVSDTGVERVDFVKMDIEGSEVEAVAAAEVFFRHFKPRIIVEPHPLKHGHSLEPVRALLERYGYRCDVIEQYGVSIPLLTGIPFE